MAANEPNGPGASGSRRCGLHSGDGMVPDLELSEHSGKQEAGEKHEHRGLLSFVPLFSLIQRIYSALIN